MSAADAHRVFSAVKGSCIPYWFPPTEGTRSAVFQRRQMVEPIVSVQGRIVLHTTSALGDARFTKFAALGMLKNGHPAFIPPARRAGRGSIAAAACILHATALLLYARPARGGRLKHRQSGRSQPCAAWVCCAASCGQAGQRQVRPSSRRSRSDVVMASPSGPICARGNTKRRCAVGQIRPEAETALRTWRTSPRGRFGAA